MRGIAPHGFKKVLSYGVGLSLGLLIVAPMIVYTIPLIVNSYHWLYLVCASGLLGMFLLTTRLHALLKVLTVYLFCNCFISQVPYLSFNAFILIVASMHLFLLFSKCDYGPILRFVEAAFWFQVILSTFQLLGMDSLVNFRGIDFSIGATGEILADPAIITPPVVMGTVMQYMRMATTFAIMAPFLLIKSKWYLVPLLVICIASKSSTFAFSLGLWSAVYLFFKTSGNSKAKRTTRKILFSFLALTLVSYAAYDWGSFRGAIIPSNGGRLISWAYVIKTWLFDLSGAQAGSLASMNGPFNAVWFLFGHGMDTFLPLFPFYKHDMNPFPQAHNDWFQIAWETGIVGFGFLVSYCAIIARRLLKYRLFNLLAGSALIASVMFLSFPTRMTQTMFLIIAYLALCQKAVDDEKTRYCEQF